MHTHLFSSHRLVFPALVPVPAPFPQSGRHRSVPSLYLPCVLWQNRGKWLWRWRGPWALWLDANKSLLSCSACGDKVGWCRGRERVFERGRESLMKPLSAVRSWDRKSTHSEPWSRFALCYHEIVFGEWRWSKHHHPYIHPHLLLCCWLNCFTLFLVQQWSRCQLNWAPTCAPMNRGHTPTTACPAF